MTILFAESAGGDTGHRAENFCEIVIIGDAHGLGYNGNGLICPGQQKLGSGHSALGDHLGQSLAAGETFGQSAQFGAADSQRGGDGGQREFFHVMLIQINLQSL